MENNEDTTTAVPYDPMQYIGVDQPPIAQGDHIPIAYHTAPPSSQPLDTGTLNKAEIKQFRKNIERLKTLVMIDQLKSTPHFNIGQFFQLGKK